MSLLARSTALLLAFAVHVGSAAAASLLAGEEHTLGPLRWRGRTVSINLSSSLLRDNPNIKAGTDVRAVVLRSLRAWELVADVSFQVTVSDRQSVSPAGRAGDGISLITTAATPENVLLFSKDASETAATTRVFFNKAGVITEGDIVLNPYLQFSSDGTFGTFDLESALTHEIGHLLGLEHSPVLGAAMHDDYARNGLFGSASFGPRTLSGDDIAAVRSRYGAPADLACCVGYSSRLVRPNGKPAAEVFVWAESTTSGALLASGRTAADGTFSLEGLLPGSYRIHARDARPRPAFAPQQIAEVELKTGTTRADSLKLAARTLPAFDLQLAGINAQLSDLAVPVEAGSRQTLYLGGRGLDPTRQKIAFSTPLISVVPRTATVEDFGEGIDAIRVEIRVSRNIEPGAYSVFLQAADGSRRYLIGAISVRAARD